MITFLLSQAGEEIYSFKKLGSCTFKEVWGAYAYGGFLFASTQDGVKILNIYNLRDSVKGIQLVEFRTGTRPVGTAYYKGFFYVGVNALSGPEINVVSFTDGKVATSIPTGGRIVSLGISSNYLFVLTSLGLEIYDLTDPKSPQNFANLVFSAGSALSMYPSYPYVIVSLGAEGLIILKVEGNSIKKVYEYRLPDGSPVLDAVPYGSYIYIASGMGGIKILNTASQNPLVGEIKTEKPASRVVIYNRYLFASLGNGGLMTYILTNPASPTVFGYYSNNLFLYDIAVYENIVALAFGQGGLITLRISPN